MLASAAQQVDVQPRFVGILEELAGSQAECLERVAFGAVKDVHFPAACFDDSFLDFAEYNIRESFEKAIRTSLKRKRDVPLVLDQIVKAFSRPGVLVSLVIISDHTGEIWEDYDSVAETGIRDEANLSILESLGLVKHVCVDLKIRLNRSGYSTLEVSTYYHHLTLLGVEFCNVCSKSRVSELEKVDEISRKQKVERDRIFE